MSEPSAPPLEDFSDEGRVEPVKLCRGPDPRPVASKHICDSQEDTSHYTSTVDPALLNTKWFPISCFSSGEGCKSLISNLKCQECGRIPSLHNYVIVRDNAAHANQSNSISIPHVICRDPCYEHVLSQQSLMSSFFSFFSSKYEVPPAHPKIPKDEFYKTLRTNTKVRCGMICNDFCDFEGSVAAYLHHVRTECAFAQVTCDGCKRHKCLRKFMLAHQRQCVDIKVSCLQLCGMKVKRRDMESHITHRCGNTLLKCDNKDCDLMIKRSAHQVHVRVECPERTVDCEYKALGCRVHGTGRIKARLYENHLREFQADHLKLQVHHLHRKCKDLKARNEDVQMENMRLSNSVYRLKSQMQEMAGEISDLKQDKRDCMAENNILRNENVRLKLAIKSINKKKNNNKSNDTCSTSFKGKESENSGKFANSANSAKHNHKHMKLRKPNFEF